MEAILDCYFDQVFSEMDRSSLFARYKRKQIVEYFNTIITGCCAGEECNSESACRRAVLAAIRYHSTSKNDNGKICLMGKYHNVLYVAAKLCFDWKLKDTSTVATLLDEMYSCEKTFERILVGAVFGTTAPHFIAGWKSDFKDREENVRALMYFLDHATTAGLEYSVDANNVDSPKVRFIDVPMESCGRSTPLRVVIQLGTPDLLLILLRFGAILTPEGDAASTSSLETILDRLIDFKRVYPFTLVACLKFIMRTIPTLRLPPTEEEEATATIGSNRLRDVFLSRYPSLIEDSLVPETRCGIQPPELKHLSRCAVRHRLWHNYQLPYGIKKLSVPEEMHTYLDLQTD